jgi:hypothetical protein
MLAIQISGGKPFQFASFSERTSGTALHHKNTPACNDTLCTTCGLHKQITEPQLPDWQV